MPAERAPMRKIRDVLRLKFGQGVSERRIAVAVGMARSTIADCLGRARVAGIGWPIPEGIDDAELERRLFPAQSNASPSRLPPDWSRVHQELQRRSMTLQLLWEEYRGLEPEGYGYSQFCGLYGAWRQTVSATMRQTHGAGEKLFVDFAGDTVAVIDPTTGEVAQAHVFVAVLGASNYTYAEARWSEALPDWIGAHVNAFTAIGGVAHAIVCDNLKAGVTAACRYEPGINRTYQDLATHYDTAILPARPYKPRDKAKVEVAVLIVQRYVLARLRNQQFFGLVELNAAIRAVVADLNARVMRKIGSSRVAAKRASGTTSCWRRSTVRHSKPCRSSPTLTPCGSCAGWASIIMSRSISTITRRPTASCASASRRASPAPRSRSSTRGLGSRATCGRRSSAGTRRRPSTCRARIGVTPTGRRNGSWPRRRQSGRR